MTLRRSKHPCPHCHHEAVSFNQDGYHCWWCGQRGDCIDFLVYFAHMSRAEALAYTGLGQELEDRAALYQEVLAWCQQDSEPAAEYLRRRRINPEVYPHGFCPAGLLERKLSREARIRWGLASAQGFNLLGGRAVFPVYDNQHRIVHFQCRSLDPEDSLRWISTVGPRPITDYLFNAQQWQGTEQVDVLFICEGISDTLSLLSLNLAAVGTFGIYPPFRLWTSVLAKAEYIVLAYDADRHPLGHPKAGQYISWPSVLEQWSWEYRDLKAPAYVWLLPSGYKDVNEWLVKNGSAEALREYLKQAPPVEEFALSCASIGAQVRILGAHKRPDVYRRWQAEHAKDWSTLMEELAWR